MCAAVSTLPYSDDTVRAKQNPPKGMDPEELVQIIDGLFTTSSYKNRSLKNTANRSKQLSRRVVSLNMWKAGGICILRETRDGTINWLSNIG
ncbi:hypothetical protein R6Q57_006564 [Mikania cordata]